MNSDDAPVFPIRLYIYNPDGSHGTPFFVYSEQELEKTRSYVAESIRKGREVVMTDPGDMCLFHAKNGRIIFPCRNPA